MGLSIGAAGWKTHAENYTRFSLITHEDAVVAAVDEVIVAFAIEHRPGTLVEVACRCGSHEPDNE